MNNFILADYIDLTSAVLLLYNLGLVFLSRRAVYVKILFLGLITILSLLPIYMQSNLLYLIRGAMGQFSISTLLLLWVLLVRQLFNLQFRLIGRLSAGILFVFGLVLYASVLGFLPFDLYDMGFIPNIYLLGLILLILWLIFATNPLLGLIFLLSLVGYWLNLQTSINIWDYLFNPLIWIIAFIDLVRKRTKDE